MTTIVQLMLDGVSCHDSNHFFRTLIVLLVPIKMFHLFEFHWTVEVDDSNSPKKQLNFHQSLDTRLAFLT